MTPTIHENLQRQIADIREHSRRNNGWPLVLFSFAGICSLFFLSPVARSSPEAWAIGCGMLLLMTMRGTQTESLGHQSNLVQLPDLTIGYGSENDMLYLTPKAPMWKTANPLGEPRISAALGRTTQTLLREIRPQIRANCILVRASVDLEAMNASVTLVRTLTQPEQALRARATGDDVENAICALMHLGGLPNNVPPSLVAVRQAGLAGQGLASALCAMEPLQSAQAMRGLKRSKRVADVWLRTVAEQISARQPDDELGRMQTWLWSWAMEQPSALAWKRWMTVAGQETRGRLAELTPMLEDPQRRMLFRALKVDGRLTLSKSTDGQLTDVR